MNTLTPDQILTFTASELAQHSGESLFQLKNNATDLLAAAKAISEHIDRALTLKYADHAQALRLSANKDTEKQLQHLPAACRSDFGLTRYQASALLSFSFNKHKIQRLVMTAHDGYREAA